MLRRIAFIWFCLLLAANVLAAAGAEPIAPHSPILKASSVLESAVQNPRGEKLGTIDDLVVDIPAGRLSYVLLNTGANWNASEGKQVPVPLTLVQLSDDGSFFFMDADRRLLLSKRLNLLRPGSRIYEAAGAAAGTSNLEQTSVRLRDLIGSTIRSANGDKLGRIREVAIDLQQKTVRYVVIGRGGFLGIGQKLFALDISQLAAVASDDGVLLKANHPDVRMVPIGDKWPESLPSPKPSVPGKPVAQAAAP